ncbi:MAG: class I SAM-dependent methyltransferase [Solirubrobacteraceae bacterium]
MELSERRRAAWEHGEFQQIASAHTAVGALLCQSADVRPGQRVLDVAAGTGNASLAAAARGADVIASDFVPELLEVAQRRAKAESLALQTAIADAQDLPFEDESFDVVLSTFGAMFAADQPRAACELLRVCRRGGRIAMANWTPGGLVGTNLEILRGHLASRGPAAPSTDWGIPRRLRELLGDRISDLRIIHRTTDMCAASPQALVELHRQHLPPVRAAFGSLTTNEQRAQLAAALATDLDRYNRAADGTLLAAAEYLEVIATKS